MAATAPRFMRVTAEFLVRGGIYTTVVVEHRKRGWKPAAPVARRALQHPRQEPMIKYVKFSFLLAGLVLQLQHAGIDGLGQHRLRHGFGFGLFLVDGALQPGFLQLFRTEGELQRTEPARVVLKEAGIAPALCLVGEPTGGTLRGLGQPANLAPGFPTRAELADPAADL